MVFREIRETKKKSLQHANFLNFSGKGGQYGNIVMLGDILSLHNTVCML